jgi:hypothetical protein
MSRDGDNTADRQPLGYLQHSAQGENRVNTAYMVMSFSWQPTATAVGNRPYAQGGWVYSGSCSSKITFSFLFVFHFRWKQLNCLI